MRCTTTGRDIRYVRDLNSSDTMDDIAARLSSGCVGSVLWFFPRTQYKYMGATVTADARKRGCCGMLYDIATPAPQGEQ